MLSLCWHKWLKYTKNYNEFFFCLTRWFRGPIFWKNRNGNRNIEQAFKSMHWFGVHLLDAVRFFCSKCNLNEETVRCDHQININTSRSVANAEHGRSYDAFTNAWCRSALNIQIQQFCNATLQKPTQMQANSIFFNFFYQF